MVEWSFVFSAGNSVFLEHLSQLRVFEHSLSESGDLYNTFNTFNIFTFDTFNIFSAQRRGRRSPHHPAQNLKKFASEANFSF